MSLEKLLAEALKELEPTVIKTIPVKPKWKKKHDEAAKLIDQMAELHKKVDKLHKTFWGMVEKEAKLKGKPLQYNEKENVIEVLKY